MRRRVFALAVLSWVSIIGSARALDTLLDVNGDQVTIHRDDFGVPHIFAETNRGLFVGYGYAVAQDRLWQLELFRRISYGRVAEILGTTFPVTNTGGGGAASALAVDLNTRTRRYTPAELDEQLALLTEEEAGVFTAYADGISRYLSEVVAPDPANKLPYEFHLLGIGVPALWTARDVVACSVFHARFGEVPAAGGQERQNLALLTSLRLKWSPTVGFSIFNDVFWLDDPDSPVSVPHEGATGKRQKADAPAAPPPEQLLGAPQAAEEGVDIDEVLEALGVPTGLGSHGWVVSAAKSANGSAMLFGGPQFDFNTPEVVHEVQLKGGNGFDVMGASIAGAPVVIAGRTDHIAFSPQTGTFGDNRDTYAETLCGGGIGYFFNGACTPFEMRVEVIDVKGAAPVTCTVRRTVHGPVVFPACNAPFPGTAGVFTEKRTDWKSEVVSILAFLAADRARNVQDFEAAIRRMNISLNFVYADKVGNIAYFGPADTPVRPAGFDPRLPLPGTGNAEWTGELVPMPRSINPTQGWLAGWNNKPSSDPAWHNPDNLRTCSLSQTGPSSFSCGYGKQFRVLDIFDRLSGPGLISEADMQDVEKYISRSQRDGDGRESRFLRPYLLAALQHVPPSNPLAPQAIAVLRAWDGGHFDDPVTSTTFAPGQVIFSRWLTTMLVNTFQDELGANVNRASVNMLLHVLDQACPSILDPAACPSGGSGVPPSRDYFNGVDASVVISSSFDQALAALGPDPSAWSSVPRNVVHLRHTLYPQIVEVGSFLESNRATYAQIVILGAPSITSTNVLTLGQSGFIRGAPPGPPAFDLHFADQLDLTRLFQYKPMHFYKNTQLQE
jgi:penicillin amidase